MSKKQIIDSILEIKNGDALIIIEEYYKNKVRHEEVYEYQKIIGIYQCIDIQIFYGSQKEEKKAVKIVEEQILLN